MFLFLIGLILLIIVAKLFVLGATAVGQRLSLSPLIIGLTIVAFGTSSPEIAVCSLAAWRDQGAIVCGNIIGSNIFNLLFILGLISVISPIIVRRRLIYWDVPIMIFASLLFWAFSSYGRINRPEGFLLLFGAIAYLFLAFCTLKEEEIALPKPVKGRMVWHLFALAFGLILLAYGSSTLINGVKSLALHWQLSPLFLSLTLVAIGTSLPELFTTLVMMAKKEGEMALGSLIGSNILNLFVVGGIAAIIKPVEVAKNAMQFDLPVLFATAVALLPIAFTGHKIARWEGFLFLGYYALYLIYLGLEATRGPLLPLFQTAFFLFIVPLTAITLLIAIFRHKLHYRN